MLETAPQSPALTAAGLDAIEGWIDVIAGVFERGGLAARAARTHAELVVAAMEGALVLARVRQSTRPILDVGRMLGEAAR